MLNESVRRVLLFFAVFVTLLFLPEFSLHAQRVALRTNLLHWAALTPNVGGEFTLGSHWSLGIDAGFNPFSFDESTTRLFYVQPEGRYWFDRPMVRHFVGIAALAGGNDLLWKGRQYEGDAFGAGITYGYAWILNRHLNLEASVGAGYLWYRQFDYKKGATKPETPNRKGGTLFPIRVGVSLVYVIW